MITQNGRIRVARAVENIYFSDQCKTTYANANQCWNFSRIFLHFFVGKEVSAVVGPGEEYKCEKASILALWLSA